MNVKWEFDWRLRPFLPHKCNAIWNGSVGECFKFVFRNILNVKLRHKINKSLPVCKRSIIFFRHSDMLHTVLLSFARGKRAKSNIKQIFRIYFFLPFPNQRAECNRTYYGNLGITYNLELHRPKEDRIPYICELTFTAAGGVHGDLIQVSRHFFLLPPFCTAWVLQFCAFPNI